MMVRKVLWVTKFKLLPKRREANSATVSGFEQPELYVSYGHGDEELAVLYSQEALPRLLGLKEKWDPNNVYRYNYPLIR